MNIPSESPLSTVPYPRHPYTNPSSKSVPTPGKETQRSDSTTTSTNSMTRQVSPGTMFGGVDALVESQDWWLRDQASLAVGFDNWGMGVGNNSDINSGLNGNSADVGPMTGMGSGFYMSPTENRGSGSGSGGGVYGDDDWTAYNR
jgi:hypothetical protein